MADLLSAERGTLGQMGVKAAMLCSLYIHFFILFFHNLMFWAGGVLGVCVCESFVFGDAQNTRQKIPKKQRQ